MRIVDALPVLALVSPVASAQPVSLEAPPACRESLSRFVDQPRWWEAATQWSELAAPRALDSTWSPLQFASMVHGASYYLVVRPETQKCYVAICGDTGNVCRYFEVP